jgi:hypothetical protein
MPPRTTRPAPRGRSAAILIGVGSKPCREAGQAAQEAADAGTKAAGDAAKAADEAAKAVEKELE